MRRPLLVLFAALVLAAPAGASGPDLGAVPAKKYVKPDSSRFLPRWLHARLEAGMSWMQSPREVSDRYAAGVEFGGALVARLHPRLRLATRVEYLDLPNGENGSLGTYGTSPGGQVYVNPSGGYNAFSGGYSLQALGLVSARVWSALWLEGGAGHGHFDSGYPRIQFIDGVTGEFIEVPGQTGWGPAYAAGLSYEFTVRKRDTLYLSARWTRLERDGYSLDFVPIAIGWRFE